MSWDLTAPADTDPIRQGASSIRTFKNDLQTALQVEHVFPGASTSSPVVRWKPRRDVVGNRPANDGTNPGTVFIATDLNEVEVDTGTAWTPVAHVIPPGMIMPYAASTAPGGWLVCNGSTISRTTYASLFAVIGTTFGSGDGSTTFNLPDFRGRFLRMVDGSAGRDPDSGSRTAMNSGGSTGNNIGSVQAGATAKNGLSASVTDPGHLHGQGVTQQGAQTAGGSSGTAQPSYGNTASATTGISVSLTGDNETRPVNAYVNYVIKY